MNSYPMIIQGGMGAGVSSWRLARAVSQLGQLGVVSGTALDAILARRLQDGDPGGHMRRGLDNFPFPKMAERIWQAYYIPGGKPKLASYKTLPMHTVIGLRELRELSIVANFVEVFLAREGHGNPVGINYLEKIQLPLLPCVYGAMLAGVDYVLVGAGVPLKIPGVLDQFTSHESAMYPLDLADAQEGGKGTISFAPRDYMECDLPPLRRPKFLAIIASNTLATTLVKKANGCVDGFIVEGSTAGGHNAPPRGKLQLSPSGEPVYGERDIVDLTKLLALNLPFWLAGGYASPEKLREALAAGAAGIQVGTAFAFCAESSLCDDYKHALLNLAVSGQARVITDPIASPTNFPFKVALLEGTLSDPDVYSARPRICDLGFLREAYRTADGSIDFRCPAEPVSIYVSKGGKLEDTQGRKCLCNALVANIGLPQVRNGKHIEKGLVTSGDGLAEISRFLPANASAYCAADVLSHLLNG
ncbi:MAG: 2-nitropropane dioxygenase [Acidobacteria bacterium RIFCSPLOWO2_12_FULL_54_10]|nr:MAG: 2-nitropropane dioxygenase [Acidobacteria bacterium RIFCSPLOWO2_12_FULL_54_10]